jgi:hypothetical protein
LATYKRIKLADMRFGITLVAVKRFMMFMLKFYSTEKHKLTLRLAKGIGNNAFCFLQHFLFPHPFQKTNQLKHNNRKFLKSTIKQLAIFK